MIIISFDNRHFEQLSPHSQNDMLDLQLEKNTEKRETRLDMINKDINFLQFSQSQFLFLLCQTSYDSTAICILFDLFLSFISQGKYFLLPASEYPYEERESACKYNYIKQVEYLFQNFIRRKLNHSFNVLIYARKITICIMDGLDYCVSSQINSCLFP